MPITVSARSTFGPGSGGSTPVGAVKPDATNTGWNPALQDGTLTGTQNITTPNTTIENKQINGRVIVNAANVTLRNCLITAGTSSEVIQCLSTGTLIEDCTILPADADDPAYIYNGVRGHHFTARRLDVSGVCDGFSVYNPTVADPAEVVIEYCWVHDLWYGDDPGQTSSPPIGKTHNDGIQLISNGGLTIRYNAIEMFAGDWSTNTHTDGTSCFIATNGAGPPPDQPDIHIYGNWLSGNVGALVHIAASTTPTTVYINDNILDDVWTGDTHEELYIYDEVTAVGLRTTDGLDDSNGNWNDHYGRAAYVNRV